MTHVSRLPPDHTVCHRRTFLRSAGVFIALPALASLGRLPAAEPEPVRRAPRRMIAVCNNLGMLPERFFPATSGHAYQLSPYLEVIAQHRADFTVFSGISHPEVDGGHPADNCFLTAAPHPANSGFRNRISLDQFAAQRIGHLTRFPSLTLGVNVAQGQRSQSWTTSGALIPCEERPAALFARLFIQGTPDEVVAQKRRLHLGESIMDTVSDQVKRAQATAGARDRERLEQYFTSVRDLEGRLLKARAWEDVAKPTVAQAAPEDPAGQKDFMEKTRLLYQLSALAMETDSTRLITILLDGVNSFAPLDIAGETITDTYHNLSHHGQNPAKLNQLAIIETTQMKLLGDLLTRLKHTSEADGNLLDHTMVLYGSNMGNANTHLTTNLPVLLAGGGFKHGQHLAFDREHNQPLANLYVSMLQRLGLEVDRFASSSGTLTGLEQT